MHHNWSLGMSLSPNNHHQNSSNVISAANYGSIHDNAENHHHHVSLVNGDLSDHNHHIPASLEKYASFTAHMMSAAADDNVPARKAMSNMLQLDSHGGNWHYKAAQLASMQAMEAMQRNASAAEAGQYEHLLSYGSSRKEDTEKQSIRTKECSVPKLEDFLGGSANLAAGGHRHTTNYTEDINSSKNATQIYCGEFNEAGININQININVNNIPADQIINPNYNTMPHNCFSQNTASSSSPSSSSMDQICMQNQPHHGSCNEAVLNHHHQQQQQQINTLISSHEAINYNLNHTLSLRIKDQQQQSAHISKRINGNNDDVNIRSNCINSHLSLINHDDGKSDQIVAANLNNSVIKPANKRELVVRDSPARKLADTFGQRTSQYRGVTRHRWTGRYEAHLWDNTCRKEGQTRKGRQVYLGGYDKEEKAARAYDLAALKYWGPTTHINFPVSTYEKELEEMKPMTKQEYIASLRRQSSGFSRGASIYRGVTRHHQHGRWQARIGRVAGNKDLYLGTFSTQEEAAEAYDIAAIKFRGANAVTNFETSRYDVQKICASNTLLTAEQARKQPSVPNAMISNNKCNQPLTTITDTIHEGNVVDQSLQHVVLHDTIRSIGDVVPHSTIHKPFSSQVHQPNGIPKQHPLHQPHSNEGIPMSSASSSTINTHTLLVNTLQPSSSTSPSVHKYPQKSQSTDSLHEHDHNPYIPSHNSHLSCHDSTISPSFQPTLETSINNHELNGIILLSESLKTQSSTKPKDTSAQLLSCNSFQFHNHRHKTDIVLDGVDYLEGASKRPIPSLSDNVNHDPCDSPDNVSEIDNGSPQESLQEYASFPRDLTNRTIASTWINHIHTNTLSGRLTNNTNFPIFTIWNDNQ